MVSLLLLVFSAMSARNALRSSSAVLLKANRRSDLSVFDAFSLRYVNDSLPYLMLIALDMPPRSLAPDVPTDARSIMSISCSGQHLSATVLDELFCAASPFTAFGSTRFFFLVAIIN